MDDRNVGIAGIGVYIPTKRMSANELAIATNNRWTEQDIVNKLGIVNKTMPDVDDGTQRMAVKAAKECLINSNVSPEEIDVIISVGEEWKEYPLTTTALYIQGEIGAVNAWGIDFQNRCSSTVSAMKIAKDMLLSDDEISTIMIAGGYRNSDLVDYTNKFDTMLYNLSAGAGAIILRKNLNKNILLGTHIVSDGTLARSIGVKIGGQKNPVTKENIEYAYQSLNVLDGDYMKKRLDQVSIKNWMKCIDKAFEKSKLTKDKLDYLAILHMKPAIHKLILNELGLHEHQSIYLKDYGHMGQVDQILSLDLALKQGKIKEGQVVSMLAAGVGFVWSANVIRWGNAD